MSRTLLCSVAFFSLVVAAEACANGTVTHFSGAVTVERADGTALPATPGAKVRDGDSVVTGAGGYARLEMTDGGEMVLRPDTRLKIESYKFNESKPQEDNFVLRLVKGGLRTVSGLIGKRGNRDAYEMKTQTATIGIRGTQWDTRVCDSNCGRLPPGTYVSVQFGAIHTANSFGGLDVAAGHAAHVPQFSPPVLLPRDPGIGFTPPPAVPKPDERKKQQNPSNTGGPSPAPRSEAAPTPQAAGEGESCNVE